MRVLVIGHVDSRRRLRAALAGSRTDVVGEFESAGDARRAGVRADALIQALDDEDPEDDLPVREPLTRRELEVLELLAEGLANKAIAGRLEISDQTVKFHIGSIIGKLGAANRTDAVRRGVRRGLIAL